MSTRMFSLSAFAAVLAVSVGLASQTSQTLSYLDGYASASMFGAAIAPHGGKVLGASTTISGDDPSTVLIVVNDATPPEAGTNGVGASVWVGQHYAAVRGIPSANIFHISWDPYPADHDWHDYTHQRLSYQGYTSVLRDPLRQFLQQNNLTNKINYIVPTYGVPYEIDMPNGFYGASLDAFLNLLNSDDSTLSVANNMYRAVSFTDMTVPHFRNYVNPQGYKLYLVSRLDGPSALEAAGLADKAVSAEQTLQRGSGTSYFDTYGGTFGTFVNAYRATLAAGFSAVENTSGNLTTSAPNTQFAWGAYGPDNGAYTFLPGAVGAQLTSYTANQIRGAASSYPNGNWVPNWIDRGITATWGATAEPNGAAYYTAGDILLNHFYHGYNFAESAYLATPYLRWTMLFVGDPLYAPKIFQNAPAGPTISSFAADNITLTSGQSTTLRWSVSGANSLMIDGIGDVSGQASVTVSPTITTSYMLTASGSGGVDSRSVTISVVPVRVVLPDPQVTAHIDSSNQVSLSWPPISGAAGYQVTRSPGFTTTNGYTTNTAYVDGSVGPGQIYTYRVFAYDAKFNYSASLHNAVTVSTGGISSPPPVSNAPTISAFTATPATITAGQVATLSWQVSGATSVTINQGVGNVTNFNVQNVAPSQTTTYTLSAANNFGSATKTITLIVSPQATPTPTPTLVPTPTPTPTFSPTPTPAPQDAASPIGYFDTAANGQLTGWAYDPDSPTQPVTVTVYLDQLNSSSQMLGQTTTNADREDVNTWLDQNYPVRGQSHGGQLHGYIFSLPVNSQSGASVATGYHNIYVVAQDTGGDHNKDFLLRNSPIPYLFGNLPAPTPAPTIIPTPTPTPTPTPVPTPMNNADTHLPMGYIDSTSGGHAVGWAYDQDTPVQQEVVIFYADQVDSSHTLGQINTTVDREDVNAWLNKYYWAGSGHIGEAHGFDFAIPSQFANGSALPAGTHNLYAVAQDTGGDHGKDFNLTHSPMPFSTGTITPTPTPTPVATPTPAPTPTPTPTVTPTPVGAPGISFFTASPGTITSGQTATLSWQISGASSVSIDQGVGSVSGITAVTVSPQTTTTYTLTAANSSGSVTKTVVITVSQTQPTANSTNFASMANGATANGYSAYITNGSYQANSAIAGNRSGQGWGTGTSVWDRGTWNSFPYWLEVDFSGPKTISEVDVFTVQDNYATPVTPATNTTFSLYGLSDFEVQYFNGSGWVDVPNGHVTNNNLVWNKFAFAPLTTLKIRVLVNSGRIGSAAYNRIVDVEAY